MTEHDRLIDALRDMPDEMSRAWGGNSSWITTGSHVAELVRGWLEETITETRVIIHKRNNLRNSPVCFQNDPATESVIMEEEIDEVTCVKCLRMLARDAVIYGNAKRPSRKW